MKILISENQLKYLVDNYDTKSDVNLLYLTENIKKETPKKIDFYLKVAKKTLMEGNQTRSQLPQKIQNAIKQVENTYGVKITDDNIQKEFDQEGQYYPDNGKIDSEAFSNLKNLLNDLYKNFPKAPKNSNANCDNLAGCVSGYRGYSTQAATFGSKIASQGGVSGRQKASAIPGFSQHATGKTFDILNLDPSWWNSNKNIKDWVANNVCKYGFKVTYLTDGVLRMAEPWHIYYTGDFCGEKTKSTEDKGTDSGKSKLQKFIEDYFNLLKKNSNITEKSSEYDIKIMKLMLYITTKDKSIEFNGILDENTSDIIKKFQRDNSLTETGYFDTKTQSEMVRKLYSKSKNITTSDSKPEETISKSENISIDTSTMTPASSKRRQTYGWRGPIGSLCAQGKNPKRYCNWHWHAGRDYAGTRGTPIVLLKGGKMIEKGSVCFKIQHDDRSITKYCHCDDVYFNQGDYVPSGTIVATLGNKGFSTGPHLHFEYYPTGDNTRTETKGKVSVKVKDVDPKDVDDTIFAFVKPGNENKYKKQGGKI